MNASRPILVVLLAACVLATPAAAQVNIPGFGVPVLQNFDTLAPSGSSAVLPSGWAFVETGSAANALYAAGDGSSGTGDTYSFGAVGSGERALGGLRDANLVPLFGAAFRNGAGGVMSNLSITYTGEQWRLGALGRTDRLEFQYSLDATSLVTGTWNAASGLDFTAPVTSGTIGPLDGNSPPNRTIVSASLTGLSIAPGAVFWIRWVDFDAAGADDALAVDGFSITGQTPPVSDLRSAWGRVKALYH